MDKAIFLKVVTSDTNLKSKYWQHIQSSAIFLMERDIVLSAFLESYKHLDSLNKVKLITSLMATQVFKDNDCDYLMGTKLTFCCLADTIIKQCSFFNELHEVEKDKLAKSISMFYIVKMAKNVVGHTPKEVKEALFVDTIPNESETIIIKKAS